MRQYTRLAALLLLPTVIAAPSSTIKVAAPGTVPSGASQIVDHAFASFSFPAHWLPDFAGRYSLKLETWLFS